MSNYFPIQFSPSDVPLAYIYQHPPEGAAEIDGKIIGIRCTGKCIAAGGGMPLVDWEIVRIRDDRRRELASKKYFGNDFYTAELIWLNYVDPFPLEQLWEGPLGDYFMKTKNAIYHAQTSTINFVKSQRMASLKHASWVVDIGIGKGQDLGRYLDAEIQHLVAIDVDRAALSELVRRKYNYAKRSVESKKHIHSSTTIHILAANANDPFNKNIERLESLGLTRATADALVCNLAVHYFLADISAMRYFVALARNIVKVGGHVMMTILIGENVHAALKQIPEGGTWDIFEGTPPARKYSIKRLYSSDNLEVAGQRIGVLLPFSDGQYYEEFLVNTKAFTAEFVARGFKLVALTNISQNIPDFEVRNRSLAGKLTIGDRKWLSLYGELVYQRIS